MSSVFERPKKKKTDVLPPEEMDEQKRQRSRSERRRRGSGLRALAAASEFGDTLSPPTLLGR